MSRANDDFSKYSISCILGHSTEPENGLDLSAKSYHMMERKETNPMINHIITSSQMDSMMSQSSYALGDLPISVISDSQSFFHLHEQRAKRRRTKVTDGKDDKVFISNEIEEFENLFSMRLWLWNAIMKEFICNSFSPNPHLNHEHISKSTININETKILNKTVRSTIALPEYSLGQQSKVLGPNHLRKAKLMFFYTRYPSSSFLKSQFPDVKFEKTNTAQLVKWFSNFREFYYIQIEKFARQLLNDGKTLGSHDILIHEDLYRILVTHYNRNNQIMVPLEFSSVVKTTLEEFYLAIVNGKDKDQSWKKIIYKRIARLDQDTPTFFKDPYWIAKTNSNR